MTNIRMTNVRATNLRATMLASVLAVSAPWACAQAPTPVTEFPAGAAMVAAADLQRRVAGNTYYTTIGGTEVRVQFQSSYAFMNAGSNSDSGPWRAEDSQLCFEWKRLQQGCVQVRFVGDVLHLKRLNGEIVEYRQR